MVNAFAAFGFFNLCLPFAALELFSFFLNSQCGGGTTTCAQDPLLLHSAAEALLPLGALGVLFVSVALTYHRLMVMGRRVGAVPVARAGNSISGLVMLLLCVSAGTLEFIVFGHAAGGGADHAALALAALRALPAAATVAFFCGMMLIIVTGAAHVRAGGEAAGGTGAVDGDGPIQGLILRLLTKIAAGAAAALVSLMAMAMFLVLLHGAKY